jgi:hypothetical protein
MVAEEPLVMHNYKRNSDETSSLDHHQNAVSYSHYTLEKSIYSSQTILQL